MLPDSYVDPEYKDYGGKSLSFRLILGLTAPYMHILTVAFSFLVFIKNFDGFFWSMISSHC